MSLIPGVTLGEALGQYERAAAAAQGKGVDQFHASQRVRAARPVAYRSFTRPHGRAQRSPPSHSHILVPPPRTALCALPTPRNEPWLPAATLSSTLRHSLEALLCVRARAGLRSSLRCRTDGSFASGAPCPGHRARRSTRNFARPSRTQPSRRCLRGWSPRWVTWRSWMGSSSETHTREI
eukprot:218395-Prymnesium_polylepis.2